ncbi:hypothetical protein B0H14DRAFT_2355369, partial [Mycena olivaceomarginata]
ADSPWQSFATELTNDLRSHSSESGGTPPGEQKFVGTPDYLAPEAPSAARRSHTKSSPSSGTSPSGPPSARTSSRCTPPPRSSSPSGRRRSSCCKRSMLNALDGCSHSSPANDFRKEKNIL